MSRPRLSIEHTVFNRLVKPAVLLHLAGPKMAGLQWTPKMVSKCRKCHLRENQFANFTGGEGIPADPLQA